MKRSLASLAALAITFSLATPVFASPNYVRHKQPRLRPGAVEQAARASYASRHNRNYVRARYNALVQGMVPSLLAVTGGEENTDTRKIARPGTRQIDDWVGDDHCTRESNKCGD